MMFGTNVGTNDRDRATIDTSQIVTIIAGSSVLGAILTNGVAVFLQWRRGADNARYLALRVAVILEAFALDCSDVLVDHDLHDSTDGKMGKEHDAFPQIAPYPEASEWQALEPGLLSRILNFRNEVKFSDARLKVQWDIDPRGLTGTLSEECAHRGAEAMNLVDDLRKRYGLLPLQSAYDFAQRLRSKHAEFSEKHAERRRIFDNRDRPQDRSVEKK